MQNSMFSGETFDKPQIWFAFKTYDGTFEEVKIKRYTRDFAYSPRPGKPKEIRRTEIFPTKEEAMVGLKTAIELLIKQSEVNVKNAQKLLDERRSILEKVNNKIQSSFPNV